LILVDLPSPLAERLSRAEQLRRDGATVAVAVRGTDAAGDALDITRAGHASDPSLVTLELPATIGGAT